MTKINIPRKEEDLLSLLSKISKHHDAQAPQSPLKAAFNMDRLKHKINIITKYKQAIPSSKNEKYQLQKMRKQEIRFVSREVRSIRNFLLTIYPDEPQVIKEWGFETDD